MKKGKGKIKGNGYQWEICRKLSLAISNKDDIFIPTAGSGSRGTRRSKTKETLVTQHGDITFEDPMGKPLIDIWNVECKSGYGSKRKTKEGITKTNWCVLDCIEGNSKNPKFLEFWLQCLEDSEITKRQPVLIFRRNNKSSCIAFLHSYWKKIIRHKNLFKSFIYDSIILNSCDEKIIIIALKDFLEYTNKNLLLFANEVKNETTTYRTCKKKDEGKSSLPNK